MNRKLIASGLAALLSTGILAACGEDEPGDSATTMMEEMTEDSMTEESMTEESMTEESMTEESMTDETMTDDTVSG